MDNCGQVNGTHFKQISQNTCLNMSLLNFTDDEKKGEEKATFIPCTLKLSSNLSTPFQALCPLFFFPPLRKQR